MSIILGSGEKSNFNDTSQIEVKIGLISEVNDTSYYGIRPCHFCHKYKKLKTAQYFEITKYPKNAEPFIKELGVGVICADCNLDFKDKEAIKSRIRADFLIKILEDN